MPVTLPARDHTWRSIISLLAFSAMLATVIVVLDQAVQARMASKALRGAASLTQ